MFLGHFFLTFRSFFWIFSVILKIVLGHQNPGPAYDEYIFPVSSQSTNYPMLLLILSPRCIV
jgi:hypothetical protein